MNGRTALASIVMTLALAACGTRLPSGPPSGDAGTTSSDATSMPSSAPGLLEAATALQESGDPNLLGTSVEYPMTIVVYRHGQLKAANEKLVEEAAAKGLRVMMIERSWSLAQLESLTTAILAAKSVVSELGISSAYVSSDRSGVVVEMAEPSTQRAEALRQRMHTDIPVSAREVTQVVVPEDEGFSPSVPPMPGSPPTPTS
jgi:hypothetical protein